MVRRCRSGGSAPPLDSATRSSIPRAIATMSPMPVPQAAARHPAVRAARLLRRRRSRHPDRRAGARALRRAGLCPPRDRPQPLRRRGPEGEGRGLRRGARRDSRTPSSRWSSPPTACQSRVREAARARNLFHLDATCPLVTKVHREAEILHPQGARDRARSAMPAIPRWWARWASCRPARSPWSRPSADAARLPAAATRTSSPGSPRRRCRSTTRPRSSRCSRERFPEIVAPHKEDICYATTNRQEAVKRVAGEVDAHDRRRRAELLQLAAAARGGRARRLPARRAGPARRRDRLAALRRRRAPRRHRRRVGAGSAGRRGDRRLRRALRRLGRGGDRHAEETIAFNLPRALRDDAAE